MTPNRYDPRCSAGLFYAVVRARSASDGARERACARADGENVPKFFKWAGNSFALRPSDMVVSRYDERQQGKSSEVLHGTVRGEIVRALLRGAFCVKESSGTVSNRALFFGGHYAKTWANLRR